MDVYEVDVFDDERHEYTAIVECEDCGFTGPAVDLECASDGSWFCTPCQREYEISQEDAMTSTPRHRH